MRHSLILEEPLGPGILALTLHRPERRNALSIDLMKSLGASIQKASKNPALRMLVLRGAGEAFCTGLDLNEAVDPRKISTSAKWVAETLATVHESPLVTVACVHGAAMAGGAGLMSACDFVYATHDAKIGFPEVRRGLVAVLVTTLLHRQLKERDIRELLLTGDFVSAERAQDMGLVNKVVDFHEFPLCINRLAEDIFKGAPDAIAQTKKILNASWPKPLRKELAHALKQHLKVRHGSEAEDGIRAFLKKESPPWIKTTP